MEEIDKMKRKSKHLLIGIALLVISIIVIYFNLYFFEGSFKNLWPALVLLAGTFLYLFYFSTKKKKNLLFVLFIGTFIAISSVPLFILAVTSFEHIKILWPGFIFAIGMGMLALYFYGKKKKGVLVISILILSLSLLIWVFCSLKSQFGLIIGVSLFILGAAFLTRGFIKEGELPKPIPSPEKGENNVTEQPNADSKNE